MHPRPYSTTRAGGSPRPRTFRCSWAPCPDPRPQGPSARRCRAGRSAARPAPSRAARGCEPAAAGVFVPDGRRRGGSALPDLTLVDAIGLAGSMVGFWAVRAPHADVGGISPGSMPRGATELVQEGIIVPPVRIARGDTFEPDILALVLANVRTPDERMGDLKAQRAACAAGRDG